MSLTPQDMLTLVPLGHDDAVDAETASTFLAHRIGQVPIPAEGPIELGPIVYPGLHALIVTVHYCAQATGRPVSDVLHDLRNSMTSMTIR